MARKDTQFKKGVSGNPQGRTPMTPEINSLKKLGKEKVKEIIDLAMNNRMTEIQNIIDDENTSALIYGLAKSIKIAADKGDFATLDKILDRTIGRPKETVELTMPKPTIIRRRNGEEILLGAAYEKEEDGSSED